VRGIRRKLNEYRAGEVLLLLNQRLAYQVMSSNSSLGSIAQPFIPGIADCQEELVAVRPRSGRFKVAQHFSAGLAIKLRNPKPALAGDRFTCPFRPAIGFVILIPAMNRWAIFRPSAAAIQQLFSSRRDD
jgi:hypothetical protein